MSGAPPSTVNASANPYDGANLTRAAPPTSGPGGTLGGFASSGQPPNLAAGAIRRGRQTRGSNVTIPYARVCPAVDEDTPDTLVLKAAGGPAVAATGIKEHEQYAGLHAGEIAFVWADQVNDGTSGNPLLYGIGGGSNARDTQDRMQKLCSFRYLSKMALLNAHLSGGVPFVTDFSASNPVAITDVNDVTVPIRGTRQSESVMHANAENIGTAIHYFRALAAGLDVAKLTAADAAAESLKIFETTPNRVALSAFGAMYNYAYKRAEAVAGSAGIFGGLCSDYSHDVAQQDDGPDFGDAAFEMLKKIGALNWRPDGVVMSKLDDTESASTTAGSYARMGMLFNIAVQGPAHVKTFKDTNRQMQHKTAPRDDLFVLLTAKPAVIEVAYFKDLTTYTELRGNSTLSAILNLDYRDALVGPVADTVRNALLADAAAGGGHNLLGKVTAGTAGKVRTLDRLTAAPSADEMKEQLQLFLTYTPAAIRKVFAKLRNEAKAAQPQFSGGVDTMFEKVHASGFFDCYENRWYCVQQVLLRMGANPAAVQNHGNDINADLVGVTDTGSVFNNDSAPGGAELVIAKSNVANTGFVQSMIDLGIVGGWVMVQQATFKEFEYELAGSQQLWTQNLVRSQTVKNDQVMYENKPFLDTNKKIVGAWKIGTVLDSASMPLVDMPDTKHMLNSAMNPARAFTDQCNVAVEWKSTRALQAIFGGTAPKSRVRP